MDLEKCGNGKKYAQVLRKWHDARLEGYSVIWQAAADYAVKHLKEEPETIS